MKKFIIATAVMFCAGVVAVHADRRLVPTGEASSLATTDYGGVDYSTWTINMLVSGAGVGYGTATFNGANGVPFNSFGTLYPYVGGVFYGAFFSSGTTNDFVDVWDSSSSDITKLKSPDFRIYNVALSTGGAGSYASGFSPLVRPVRFGKGLIYRPSRADFNAFGLYFYAHE
jgi:hypothetical protein